MAEFQGSTSDVAKKALQSVKDQHKRRREMERARRDSYIGQL